MKTDAKNKIVFPAEDHIRVRHFKTNYDQGLYKIFYYRYEDNNSTPKVELVRIADTRELAECEVEEFMEEEYLIGEFKVPVVLEASALTLAT